MFDAVAASVMTATGISNSLNMLLQLIVFSRSTKTFLKTVASVEVR